MSGAAGGTGRPQPKLSIQDRLGILQRTIMRSRRVQLLLAVLADYGAAGGGLLAAGLAFNALFAIIPGLLAMVALLGIFISDPPSRDHAVETIVDQVPALAPLARTIIDTLADGSRVASIIGVLGVIWGASGFYGALEGAFTLLFPGSGSRGMIEQRVRGVLSVFALVGMVFAAIAVNSVISLVIGLLPLGDVNLFAVLAPVLACVVASAVCLIVYRLLPVRPPSWRAAVPPAILAGVGIGLLTSLFGLVAPLLVKGFAALGVIASVFAALVWLNFVFQVLLYGAAWACIRRNRERRRAAAPRI